ncbi:MAG: hypothetical protein ACR2G4_11195 [Pyrinomonadaceae bacterium]
MNLKGRGLKPRPSYFSARAHLFALRVQLPSFIFINLRRRRLKLVVDFVN